ncbi:exopolyphosphatase/guanosine-5'-triphosphate,3'-diphosphate pyrophosphatase [Inquilinus ginsengisoli]|uniref:Exopolyphosphatase/guanosine-5'-triphosphate, 3'-diphosphate pyrophosphatase n=1 Tax=Inquilinus ginsengisoli TaxID=363840 RepID=A0ABU1JVJ0_9PROT|nr:Ppx/GppA family phosphatase [Inquilinus ginsengisoli]MDR6291570.1 exopolyphosphatase/guanosine-5'-triphosphate,3'-diphosphate pyrophosphatase [Inquilinus ginsengisoli]
MFRIGPIVPSRPGRVGVIDIGSNSIRLVVYDRVTRSPVPIFNEKVMCGLGRGLGQSRRMAPDAVALAVDNLARFTRLLEGMGVDRVDVLATAAVREAEDGADFVAEVERRCGLPITIISGVEEARLSALGVISGIRDVDGVMGDLGGGSLELVGLDHGDIGEQVTLPLGPFRLMDETGARKEARSVVQDTLAQQGWLSRYSGRSFYPVGGAWRAIAKLYMERENHPLHIIHQYTVPTAAMTDFVGLVAKQSKGALSGASISRRRVEMLPMAALVLEGVLKALRPARIVFSALGLREGHLFDLLSPEDQARDPLIFAAAEIAHRLDRFGHAEVVAEWTRSAFPDETADEARLRQAASLLSDIGWFEHPDYRAEHAWLRVLRMPVAGLDHAERVFLAAAVYVRYGADLGDALTRPVLELLTDAARTRALILGQTLRLAHTLTGGATSLLERTSLAFSGDAVVLTLPADEEALTGFAVDRRLDAVAKALGRPGRVAVEESRRAAG